MINGCVPPKTGPCGPKDSVNLGAVSVKRKTTRPEILRPAVLLLHFLLLLLTAIFVAHSDVCLQPGQPISALDAIKPAIGGGNAPGPEICRPVQPDNSSKGVSDAYRVNDKYFDNLDSMHDSLQIDDLTESESFEFESTCDNVKGRLKAHFSFWHDIQASPFVLNVIQNGYSIPFISKPPKKVNKNNHSAMENAGFVSEAVADLLNKGCVALVSGCPEVVNPLSVVVNRSGKKRLILDLHEVNLHVWKDKVKFEDFKVALTYFKKTGFMFKFDLKSGYHHIDMVSWCQTYLGFCWESKYYVFTVLPFGLSSSPYVFTKCLRPMVRFWREHGIRIVLYLDDGWCINDAFELARSDAAFVYKSLADAGFLVNREKSIFTPTQSLTWLGLIWDCDAYSLSIPEQRISDLIKGIDSILSRLYSVTARKLAQVCGRIISMMPVIGNVARIKTRYLHRCIEARRSWDYTFGMSDQSVISPIYTICFSTCSL